MKKRGFGIGKWNGAYLVKIQIRCRFFDRSKISIKIICQYFSYSIALFLKNCRNLIFRFKGPGGKVEKSDSCIAAAAARECQEEVGLKPKSLSLVYVHSKIKLFLRSVCRDLFL